MKTRIKKIEYSNGDVLYQAQRKDLWMLLALFSGIFTFFAVVEICNDGFWVDIGFKEEKLTDAQDVIDRYLERKKRKKIKPKFTFIKYP